MYSRSKAYYSKSRDIILKSPPVFSYSFALSRFPSSPFSLRGNKTNRNQRYSPSSPGAWLSPCRSVWRLCAAVCSLYVPLLLRRLFLSLPPSTYLLSSLPSLSLRPSPPSFPLALPHLWQPVSLVTKRCSCDVVLLVWLLFRVCFVKIRVRLLFFLGIFVYFFHVIWWIVALFGLLRLMLFPFSSACK